jgi:hypothetical protein
MSVCCGYCVLSGRDLCDKLITRPEESYRLWCDLEKQTSWMRRPRHTRWLSRQDRKKNYVMLLLYSYIKRNIDSFHGATAPSVPGFPHYRASTITLSHTTLGRISDQPDNTQHSQETDIHAPGGIRTLNPSKRAAADPRVRPRGHWKGQ